MIADRPTDDLPATFLVARDLLLDLALLARRDDDPIDNLIQLGVSQANVRHIIASPAEQVRYRGTGDNPDEAARTPIRILPLSRTLNLPFETVRRRAMALCDAGRLVLTPDGLLAPAARFAAPEHLWALHAIDRSAARGFRQLDAIGFFGPEDLPAPEAPVADPPLRVVGRLMGDYYLRMLSPLRDWAEDPIDAVILLSLHRCGSVEAADPGATASSLGPTGADPLRWGRPVRPGRVARELGVAQETVRRRLVRLAADGLCVASEAGYALPTVAVMARLMPVFDAANALNLRRLYRLLAQFGAVAFWRAGD